MNVTYEELVWVIGALCLVVALMLLVGVWALDHMLRKIQGDLDEVSKDLTDITLELHAVQIIASQLAPSVKDHG